jgi:hypothetical protein
LDFPVLLFDDPGLVLLPDDLVTVHLCDNPVIVLLSDGLVSFLLFEDPVLVLLPDDLVTVHLCDNPVTVLLSDGLVTVHLCDNPVIVLLSDDLVSVLLFEDPVLVLLPHDLVNSLLSNDLVLYLMSHDSTLLLVSEDSVSVFHRYKEQMMIFTFLLEAKLLLRSQFLVLLLHFFVQLFFNNSNNYSVMNTASLFKQSEHWCQYTIICGDTSHLNSGSLRILQLLCLFLVYMCNYLQARLIIKTMKLLIYFYCGRLGKTKQNILPTSLF